MSRAPEPSELLAPGRLIGRYRILEVVGSGAMGVVYAAYDPELDRQVAVKVLAPEQSGDDRRRRESRLLREAKALARLSHPNVVAVHDAGTHDDLVFIAMEFVHGKPLATWLETPRTARDILEVFVAAGRGLSALHAESLVHRDFKPENVMIDPSGRVLVMDLGLARLEGDVVESPMPSQLEDEALSAQLSRLTKTGAQVGTPAFMAPEQHLGWAATARSDQFSFATALYRALYGQAPYPGETWSDLAYATLRGELRVPGARPGVTSKIRRALARALSVRPEHRFESMDELLDVLQPRRRRRLVYLAAAAFATAAALSAVVLARRGPATPGRCTVDEQRLAQIWDGDTKKRLRAAFATLDLPFAESSLATVERDFDRYRQEWLTTRRRVCEATWQSGEQSETLLDRRMACLDRRLRDLHELVQLLLEPTPLVAQTASTASSGLPPVLACATARALSAPPSAAAGDIEQSQGRVAQARALILTGNYAAGKKAASEAAALAQRLGWRAMEAEALWLEGMAASSGGDADSSIVSLRAAALAAAAGSDDSLAMQAWTTLGGVQGQRGDFEEAKKSFELAEAVLERLDGIDSGRALLFHARGMTLKGQGDFKGAYDAYREALAVRERTLGPDHLEVAATLNNLADVEHQLALEHEALTHYSRALAIKRLNLGESHPSIAITLGNRAMVLRSLGQFDEAVATYRQVLDVLSRTLSPEHPNVGITWGNLGRSLLFAGKPREAAEAFARGREILEKSKGHGHEHTAVAITNQGTAAGLLGDTDAAIRYFEEARKILTAISPDHVRLGSIATELANLHLRRDDLDRAATEFREGLRITRVQLGSDHPDLASDLVGLGNIDRMRGRFAEARTQLVRVVELTHQRPKYGGERSAALFALAQMDWDDKQKARALDRARDAAAAIEGHPAETENLARIRAWIAERTPAVVSDD